MTTPDYRYSSWSVSMAIHSEIDMALKVREIYRQEELKARINGEISLASRFRDMANNQTMVIKTLLRVHNYGKGKYAQSDGQAVRSMRPRIDEY